MKCRRAISRSTQAFEISEPTSLRNESDVQDPNDNSIQLQSSELNGNTELTLIENYTHTIPDNIRPDEDEEIEEEKHGRMIEVPHTDEEFKGDFMEPQNTPKFVHLNSER